MEKEKNLIKYFIQRNKLKIQRISNEIIKLHSLPPTKELARNALLSLRIIYSIERIQSLCSSDLHKTLINSLLFLKKNNLIFDKNDKEFMKLVEINENDFELNMVDKEIVNLTRDPTEEMVEKYFQTLKIKTRDSEIIELEALKERINKCRNNF
ncbi:hypothetical protein TCON_1383 [Astathelohania contejeani]|uniref:Uncharacterized protein n=1 Tax=Astathelohania contejeani TaxID=164912 RepID=A0ABQ7HZ21_9MICR|nr:hypothetical protein TCON_1383 [Thelohania contejeani]